MSLFDLQDVCIVIGSLATLDLPMFVDLIGIYVLKGPYRTLTTTNWFLQALSVMPRGSWGDVARRFTMIRWYTNGIELRLLVVRLSSISREKFFIPRRTVDTLYLLIEEAGFEAISICDYASISGNADQNLRTLSKYFENRGTKYTNGIELRLLVERLSSISREKFFIPRRTVDTLYLLIEEAGFEADARASGNTALSSPCWDLLAIMRRVVNFHSSWVGQQQVELFDASGIRVWFKDERVIPVCLYTYQWPPFISDPVDMCLRSLAPFLRLKPSAVV
ncbi:hypothetical protein F511_11265 [Dorcoceras hygrometricum]|uniref:Uncharacterized protein n=1 Tax=Dorcoceras hygrometricum TaxID=472368 RepID=A0A2Z7CIS7_9LAMI|nr:hypothetical protein F511_11265 [Dorcoceras hygrometricum]